MRYIITPEEPPKLWTYQIKHDFAKICLKPLVLNNGWLRQWITVTHFLWRKMSFLALAEPTICKHNSKYPRENSTTYYEFHICPTPDMNGTFITCCGAMDKEYCCNTLSWVYVVVSAGIILVSCRLWLIAVVIVAAVVVVVANTITLSYK